MFLHKKIYDFPQRSKYYPIEKQTFNLLFCRISRDPLGVEEALVLQNSIDMCPWDSRKGS